LVQAFQILLVQEVVPMKLCIFVDGLDEYSGLGSEIANLFKNAAQAPHVKVCVSSRPPLVFKESFESQKQLRLEDLTRGDIERYVVDMLKNDERMKKRHDRESPQMQELVGEIVSSASGVFLWVKLIVLDLLKGLENHDSISLLQERLKLLPTDLEELYEHMVFKVASIYRAETSRFYQLIAATAERDDDWHPVQPLTIFTLFLAEGDKDLALKAKSMFLSRDEIYGGICEIDLRLRSRCGGLLETQFGNSSIKDIAPEMNVGYIHRTVKDYLEGTGIRHILSDRTGGLSADAFNPHLALMRAYILQLKALQCSQSNLDRAEQLIHDIISYARRVESDLCQPNTELMDCFFQTATWWWQRANGRDVTTVTRECVLSNENIVTLAIKCALHEFLKARLISTGTRADVIMLNRALYPSAQHDKFVSKSVVENLLELGSNPNQVVDFIPLGVKGTPQSPWQNALTYLAVEFPFVIEQDKLVLLRRWERILKLLLQNGAKTSVYCRGPLKRARAQRLETDSSETDDTKEDKGRKSMEVVTETTLTPKEVFEKAFEKHTDILSGLLRLLEAKGPAPASVDEKPPVQTLAVAQAPKQRYRDRFKKFLRAEKTE
jgi:hypothetical protein